MKTATAKSAGGVVFDDDDRVVLLMHTGPDGRPRWSLPKGAAEKGETLEDTALREVREETGLEAEITGPAGVVDYWFVWKPDDTRYHKFVHYFPMRARGGDFSKRDAEAEDVSWFGFDDAIRTCSYENEREMIRAAKAAREA